MKRTVVSLEDDDKRWLDRRAAREGVSMTELVRQAVRLLRQRLEGRDASFDELLDDTRGIWEAEDGLEYQRRSRNAW